MLVLVLVRGAGTASAASAIESAAVAAAAVAAAAVAGLEVGAKRERCWRWVEAKGISTHAKVPTLSTSQ